ncbi:MAG: hypothetical protein JSS07_05675 [Proteobacteria bacterium]|nr:hypothetical protein [Pseudomonadota bacterium]
MPKEKPKDKLSHGELANAVYAAMKSIQQEPNEEEDLSQWEDEWNDENLPPSQSKENASSSTTESKKEVKKFNLSADALLDKRKAELDAAATEVIVPKKESNKIESSSKPHYQNPSSSEEDFTNNMLREALLKRRKDIKEDSEVEQQKKSEKLSQPKKLAKQRVNQLETLLKEKTVSKLKPTQDNTKTTHDNTQNRPQILPHKLNQQRIDKIAKLLGSPTNDEIQLENTRKLEMVENWLTTLILNEPVLQQKNPQSEKLLASIKQASNIMEEALSNKSSINVAKIEKGFHKVEEAISSIKKDLALMKKYKNKNNASLEKKIVHIESQFKQVKGKFLSSAKESSHKKPNPRN